MGLIRHLSYLFRRSGSTPSSNGSKSPPNHRTTSDSRYSILPITSPNNQSVVPLCTTCSVPLTFLATATGILFVFTCWLATARNLHSIYPSDHHSFRNSIDDHDSLGIILRPRESSIYYGQQRFDIVENEGGEGATEGGMEKEIVIPEMTQEEAPEVESRGKSRLWFKAEYTVEIPICEGSAMKNGGACIHKDGTTDKIDTTNIKDWSNWIPAIESVRVSFCANYGGEGEEDEDEEGRDEWEEAKSWDYVFPANRGPSGIHTAAEWVYGVDKRPLDKWRDVDVRERSQDTSLRTQMTKPTNSGEKPQWQFLLTTAGVYINADPWHINEEEVTVEVPVGKKINTPIKSLLSRWFAKKPRVEVEVERVLMWRWKGRYGGCPGEMDGRGVVLQVKGAPGAREWVRDGKGGKKEKEKERKKMKKKEEKKKRKMKKKEGGMKKERKGDTESGSESEGEDEI